MCPFFISHKVPKIFLLIFSVYLVPRRWSAYFHPDRYGCKTVSAARCIIKRKWRHHFVWRDQFLINILFMFSSYFLPFKSDITGFRFVVNCHFVIVVCKTLGYWHRKCLAIKSRLQMPHPCMTYASLKTLCISFRHGIEDVRRGRAWETEGVIFKTRWPLSFWLIRRTHYCNQSCNVSSWTVR
jgi:hypothetical protein